MQNSPKNVVSHPVNTVNHFPVTTEANTTASSVHREPGGNLQSYLSTTRLRELTVVFEYYKTKGTYSRI